MGGRGIYMQRPPQGPSKMCIFYPKNIQKSQISLVVGSRHTSDDSPTVTQTSLYDYLFLLFDLGSNRKEISNRGGWWRFSATPATRTLKISVFYPKNH